MKVELVLSRTYICQGKVYNNTDVAGNKVVYEVDAKTGRHLLRQSNERNVPYFRKAADDAAAHLAPKKSVDKGGIPIPVEDADAKPDPAEDEASEDDDDAPKLDADGEPVDDDDDSGDGEDDAGDDEESITV